MTVEAASITRQLPARARAIKPVALWLYAVCLLLGLMVAVGGATRLTHSGLSITEWRPVTGIVPPLSEPGWEREFAKYKAIPQFRLRNPDMTLDGFKAIYWWEWGHRLLGRMIGFVFLLPLLWFALRKQIDRALALRLGAIFVLGGAQGALGWWMVKSGLVDRISVSQYRLAAHLGLAFLIFGLTFWTARDVSSRAGEHAPSTSGPRWILPVSAGLAALVFVQVVLGALVAGTHAGFIYNTWPLIEGRIVPEGYFRLAPWYANWGENQLAVQFNHRIGAYLIVVAVAALWIAARRKPIAPAAFALDLFAGATLLQVLLGIAALLAVVPLWLGLLHQIGALILFAAALNFAFTVRKAS